MIETNRIYTVGEFKNKKSGEIVYGYIFTDEDEKIFESYNRHVHELIRRAIVFKQRFSLASEIADLPTSDHNLIELERKTERDRYNFDYFKSRKSIEGGGIVFWENFNSISLASVFEKFTIVNVFEVFGFGLPLPYVNYNSFKNSIVNIYISDKSTISPSDLINVRYSADHIHYGITYFSTKNLQCILDSIEATSKKANQCNIVIDLEILNDESLLIWFEKTVLAYELIDMTNVKFLIKRKPLHSIIKSNYPLILKHSKFHYDEQT
ncbi:gp80 [Sphingomonas phage PAU]|uniref:gp80 n=1 Tax=Sphingomonas phage PAU TaxID=1150991 RepID=UPI00025731DA|nr:gp80 [Sphingomonas phage PAU]AFF28078.1 gp80 [Sphingomonas phage PAU]